MPLSESPLRRKPLPIPGESQRERVFDLVCDEVGPWVTIMIVFGLMAAREWWDWLFQKPPSAVTATLLTLMTVAVAAYFFLRRWPHIRGERDNAWLGSEGERVVAQALDELRPRGYLAIHDIPGDGFNTDHVLIGPTGVYVIETKTRSKQAGRRDVKVDYDGRRVLVDGRAPGRDPLKQVAAAAGEIRRIIADRSDLTPFIRPVVLYPGWFVNRQPRGVDTWVLNEKVLASFVFNEPVRLSSEDVMRLHAVLGDYVRSRM